MAIRAASREVLAGVDLFLLLLLKMADGFDVVNL